MLVRPRFASQSPDMTTHEDAAEQLRVIREFAPKSMTWLGIASFSALTFVQTASPLFARLGPSGLMAATFGGFHLLYGAAIVTTTRRGEE